MVCEGMRIGDGHRHRDIETERHRDREIHREGREESFVKIRTFGPLVSSKYIIPPHSSSRQPETPLAARESLQVG